MRPEFKEHIRNIIGKLVEQGDSERDNKVCFFKHYSSFNIDEEDIINIMTSLNLGCDMLYYQFENINNRLNNLFSFKSNFSWNYVLISFAISLHYV